MPDTLGASRILGEPLQVTSTCPATGRPVTLEVEPDGITAAGQPTAVMSWVTHFDRNDARATGCGHMNLFVSATAAAAAEYQAGYPHVVNVPVAQVSEFLRPVFDAFVARATAADTQPGGEAARAIPNSAMTVTQERRDGAG